MRFPRRSAFALMLTLLAVTFTGRPAEAAWPLDPYSGGTVLAVAAGLQIKPDFIADGTGGAIAVWEVSRVGTGVDIYAQRMSATGVPQWAANGVAVCNSPNTQGSATVVADGAGGAIVAWQDFRSGPSADIYVQRINASGVVQWAANGVALCTAANGQANPSIAADGTGGAIVTWQDFRSGTSTDIYAQRINGSGVVQWALNGVALCAATSEQTGPSIVSDGAAGAIATWSDSRSGTEIQIYTQRISTSGVVQWAVDGVPLFTAPGDAFQLTLASDGAGGAIAAWHDNRIGIDLDIYAQRINASGVRQWSTNGVAVSNTSGAQINPKITSDDTGGAIVTWEDYRSGPSPDIYAQRISAIGVAQWAANGVALCTAVDYQGFATITPDGSGGAIVSWQDFRNGANSDIHAQRISAIGVAQWAVNGVALCTTTGDQNYPASVPDGAGGAIVMWTDFRSGTTYDLYAQRVERHGHLGRPEPTITGVRDVPNDQGGFVRVAWDASYLDADPVFGVSEYRVFRSVAVTAADAMRTRRAITTDSDVAVSEGALWAVVSAGTTVYWEYVGTQVAEAFAGYSRVVATTSDSVTGSNPLTLFMVEARQSTSISAARWYSAPDSGYSVDNLPPAMPAPFTGQYGGGTTALHWNRNTEADLAGYRLYRGSSAAFVPDPANLVATPPDTGYVDAAGGPYVYKLTAVDSHGNESLVATLVPGGVLDAPGGPLATFFLAPVAPNPAKLGAAATLRFGLSRSGAVRLEVIDAAGRRVRVLASGELAAGEHRVRWDGRSEGGQRAAAGLYFVRLEAEGRRTERRLALIE